jgi:hypothetical protein
MNTEDKFRRIWEGQTLGHVQMIARCELPEQFQFEQNTPSRDAVPKAISRSRTLIPNPLQ